MLAHIAQVRMIHDAWRASAETDASDVSKFPSVAIGPQVLQVTLHKCAVIPRRARI